MQYGVIPTSLTERLALLAGAVPIPLIDTLYGMMKARVIMAGVQLGVFDALAQEGHTAASLAATLRLDEPCLDLLMRSLVYCGYLELRGDRFSLSPMGRRSMTSDAPRGLAGFVQWNYMQWEFAGHLEALVRTGQGLDFHSTMTDPEAWGHYQQAMLETARFDAPVVSRSVPVREGAVRLLDLAGSHGLLGAAICKRHPPMRSTVVDLPAAIEHARRLARREGHDNLVEHVAGDVRNADLGSGWDVALLSNILHHFTPGDVRAILSRTFTAVANGGTAAIWELERPPAGRPPSEGDGVALFFRLTSTAAAYSGESYATWLTQAGFRQIRIVRPKLRPGTVLVHARK